MSKKNQLEELIAYYSNGNKTAFGAKLGLTPQGISNWLARSTFDAELIFTKCENVSAEWLLTGNGTMLREMNAEIVAAKDYSQRGVPYYDVDFCGGFDILFNDQTRLPTGYIDLPQYSSADSWANITGHSMEPLISNGDIIALRKIDDWETYILYGEVYGIMTDEWRTVKRVRRSQNHDNIILEPINKEYDTQEIPKRIIRGVWQVIGCAKKLF